MEKRLFKTAEETLVARCVARWQPPGAGQATRLPGAPSPSAESVVGLLHGASTGARLQARLLLRRMQSMPWRHRWAEAGKSILVSVAGRSYLLEVAQTPSWKVTGIG